MRFFLLKAIFILIKERFSLGQYLPMIAVFSLANAFYLTLHQEETLSITGLILGILILVSAFLRLRLFDEIKDLDTDLRINPNRPLARGAITLKQTKAWILILILFELVICFYIGGSVILFHGLAILFSLAMYKEFFIGRYLRAHLTTYAVSHTFISFLLALTVAAITQLKTEPFLNFLNVTFFLANWMFFNIFEFARKTYALVEERPGVDTYSSLFGIQGAVLLSFSQVVFGLFLLIISIPNVDLRFNIVLAFLFAVLCLVVSLNKSAKWAGIFRLGSGLYILLHYALLAASFALGLGKDFI
jgi:4-hydroxybenzoate polyprenyltransferase